MQNMEHDSLILTPTTNGSCEPKQQMFATPSAHFDEYHQHDLSSAETAAEESVTVCVSAIL